MNRLVAGLAAACDAVLLAVYVMLAGVNGWAAGLALLTVLCVVAWVTSNGPVRIAAAVGNLAFGVVALPSIGVFLLAVGVALLVCRR